MNTQPKLFFKRQGIPLIKLILIGWLSAVAFVQPVQAVTPPLTLVSLTFDDGLTQSLARTMLASHGMKGTFYVNSDRIGISGYLSKTDLDGLYADGNEIGGHTIGHVDLATLSDAAQKTAICNDMQNLVNWGYQVHSFAYPFGSTGPTTQNIMKAGCPAVGVYESARTVGGLVAGALCSGCPWAESIPPLNPYFVTTSDSIIATTPLATIQGYVTQAETHGGGWVPLVFHRICDACGTYSVSPATLNALLTWLEGRQAQNTLVKTVHQVMSGDFTAPPPPPPGPNMLINPSLEIDANNNNQPDCWSRDRYGSNTAIWTRSSDAHTGSFSQQLKVTKYKSGDLKLLPTLDAGQPSGCAPAVATGKLYQISAWYKSTVPAFSVFFYLDTANVWQYWMDGPVLPAASVWTPMSYQPGAVPMGAKAISFGIALERVGTLVTDDYSMSLVP